MPELPEVETIRRQLQQTIVGEIVESISCDTEKVFKPNFVTVSQAINGKKIIGTGRFAKFLLIELEDGLHLGIHLKMNGRLLYRSKSDKPDSYVHAIIQFQSDHELRFADSRKFGFIQLLSKDDVGLIKMNYGPEPLADLNADLFFSIINKSNRRIKDVLLDQKLIGGIGNIYANDGLWLAQIHPEIRSSLLTREETDRLLRALESVIEESLQVGGSSDHWYRHINGDIGHYQDHFKVYGKTGQYCIYHPSTKIEYMKVSQRGTFICPICQKKKI
ncbi:bifunctional DNA-formamidopyrimidine glycosylase/DNA-(apurinic or apyrimidinic site) lyase [candidate division WWE3 bacterium]|nr:bifunctional DNA-formamidopyrimidine glycosylase/DNA-(apurinic or apyrimidinic site) lyase [candidate division WWE3 bacterium]